MRTMSRGLSTKRLVEVSVGAEAIEGRGELASREGAREGDIFHLADFYILIFFPNEEGRGPLKRVERCNLKSLLQKLFEI